MIAYNYDYEFEVNMRVDHEVILMTVKNSNNSYDYFDGNNSFDSFCIISTDKNSLYENSLDIADWMIFYPKDYKNSLLEKAAYKYGINMTDSELNQMIDNIK